MKVELIMRSVFLLVLGIYKKKEALITLPFNLATKTILKSWLI